MADVSYVDWVEFPHVRLRVEIGKDGGTVTRFVVQLEYRLDDGWSPVVRFDHDPDAAMGHDVTEEGLHMDVYREGRIRGRRIVPRSTFIRRAAILYRIRRSEPRPAAPEIRNMARSEPGPDWGAGTMTDGELEAFRDAVEDLGDRVTEVLADGTEMTPDEIEAIVEELETADG